MARRFKFKPPPGVIIGTLLIWSPAIWLAREARAFRAEAAQANGPTCVGSNCPSEVEAVVWHLAPIVDERWDRVFFKANEQLYDIDLPSRADLSRFIEGERVTLRMWRGNALSARTARGLVLAAERPELHAQNAEAVLLILGLVGMGILVVGALVGGATDL